MRAAERRDAIFDELRTGKRVTVAYLAEMFGVSQRTILRDIEELTLAYPIETVCGRYGGGVKLADWYHPSKRTLSPEQMALLKKLAPSLEGNDLVVMNSIISQFAP